jgi:hypothetical protein
MSENKSKIGEFLKGFDCFGVQYGFHYKSEESYNSVIGGVVTLLFSVFALWYFITNFISFVKRENINSVYYTMTTSKTDKINFANYSYGIAFGISCDNEYDDKSIYNYLNFTLDHVKMTIDESGSSNRVKTNINYVKCDKSKFFNLLDEDYNRLQLDNFYCISEEQSNLNIQGIFGNEIFEYFQFDVFIKDLSTFDELKDILMNKECQFNFFHSSFAIDVSDYSNAVTPFLISSYFDFTPDSLNSVNYYFSLTNFETDKNILLNNPKTEFYLDFSKEENFRIYKGLDRKNSNNIDDIDVLAKIHLRADTSVTMVSRQFEKLGEFVANVTELIEQILLIFIAIFGFLDTFYAYHAVISDLFVFKGIENQNTKLFINNIKKINKENALKTTSPEENQLNNGGGNSFEKNNINNSNFESEKLKINENDNKSSNSKNLSKKENVNDVKISSVEISKNNIKNGKENDKNNTSNNVEFINKAELDYNVFEIFFMSIFSCCLCKNLKKKKDIYDKSTEILFTKMDIIAYLKNMQILNVLNKLILSQEERDILKFLSKPSINVNEDDEENKNNFDSIFTSNLNENEIQDFWKNYEQLKNKQNKTEIESRLVEYTTNNLNNLAEEEDE